MKEPDLDRAITISVDGEPITCLHGESVASALLAAGLYAFGPHPVGGAPRGPFCMSGSCQACMVRVDGHPRQACRVTVRDGQQISSGGAA